MRLEFQAVIFDMDGLLLDTERIAQACFAQTCQALGIADQSALFLRCIGASAVLGQRLLQEGLAGIVDPQRFREVWEAHYRAATAEGPLPLKAGARELLEGLSARDIPLAVATSSGTERALRKLTDAGLHVHFDAVVCGDQVAHSKPHPQIYLTAAERLGVAPSQCLALEDSENGVRSAVAARMNVIQIPDLVQPSPQLRALGHRVMGSLHEVLQAWQRS